MALHPVPLTQWCADRISSTRLTEKLQLLNERFTEVVQVTPGSLEAQQCLADVVSSRHQLADVSDQLTAAQQRAAGPLVASALTVPADLCLLTRDADSYRLTSACVTAPSYWCLADKIGLPLASVHGNVTGLNSALGTRMANLFERLPAARCFQRRNWFLHHSADRFQPKPEVRQTITSAAEARQLVLRSETQTLRRLNTSTIVFTIAVSCYPFAHIEHHPAAAATLLQAIHSRNANEREAAGQASWEPGVIELLAHTIASDG